MMPTLHMETDGVGHVGRGLSQVADELSDLALTLDHATQRLLGVWQGNSSIIFDAEMRRILDGLRQVAERGAELGQRVQHEVKEWEETARIFGISGGGGVARAPKSDFSTY